MRRAVLITADGLKVGSDLVDIANVADQIHDRWCDPAEVVQFIEFDAKPIAINSPFADSANIANCQICGVQISDSGSVTAMRLLVDCHSWERKSRCGCDGWS